jgi:hypothetical protein
MDGQGNELRPRQPDETTFADLVSTEVTTKAAFSAMPRVFGELPRELLPEVGKPLIHTGINFETQENLIVANTRGADGQMHWYVASFGGITYDKVRTEEEFIAFQQKALAVITDENEVKDPEDNLDVLLSDILKMEF